MYKPRGASITILTLLAVSSGFQFDVPDPEEVPATEPASRSRKATPSNREAGYSRAREVKGPRTHPDWVRTSALSADAARTRGISSNSAPQMGLSDGEIPM